jgi:hypothetical protein
MKLTPEAATAAVHRFALMPFFPGDPDIRAALVAVLLEMVETAEQLDWLVKRAVPLYGTWPGVGELRALFCSRWKPKDGIEAYSMVYPRGVPSERKQQPVFDAPRDRPVTADKEFAQKLKEAAEAKTLRGIPRRSA